MSVPGPGAEPHAAAALAFLEGVPAGAAVGFALLDAEAAIVSISPSLVALAGAPAGDHAGRPLRDIAPPELGAAVDAGIGGVLRSGRALEGLRVHGRVPGGEGRAWDVDLHRLDAAGSVLGGLIVTSMSLATRSAVALQESERQLAEAQRIAQVGWWSWTAAAGVVRLSPELADVLGLDATGPAGPGGEPLLEMLVGGDRIAINAELVAAARESRPFRFTQRLRRNDGSLLLIETEGEAILDRDGELAELRGIGQDITAPERGAARQRALAELGHLGLGGIEVDELLVRACALVGDALWAESVTVHEHGAPDAWRGAGVAVAIDTPHRRFGELRVHPDIPRSFDTEEIAFLDSVAHVLGEAIGRRETAAEIAALAASRGRLVGQALDGEDRARRSISDRLHDGPLQDLLAAAHELYAAAGTPEAAVAQERLRSIARDLREVMAALHPTVLRYGGLRAALVAVGDQQARAGGFAVEVTVDPDAEGHHDELVLSVARHLLANAARHADASQVTVTLRRVPFGVRLEVADDGRPPPAAEQAHAPDEGRLGLATSVERVAAVGGRLEARAAPEGGMNVVVELPAAGRRQIS